MIACHAIGLDPQLGFFHADTPGRDSLAADVMEAIWPDVDQWVLDLIGSHTFARKASGSLGVDADASALIRVEDMFEHGLNLGVVQRLVVRWIRKPLV